MGLIKRGDNWFIDYRVNGRRKREKIGTSRKLAENVLSKRRTEIAENRYLDVRKKYRVSFDDFAKTFLELHSHLNKKPRVARRDFFLINRLGSHFSGKLLSEITPQMVERYKADRIKDVKPATVNRELACLKCMLNKAIEWGKASDNPVRKVKLFKENNKRIRYLEKEEIRKLIANCPGNLQPIVIAAVFTGMRKSEILTLQWKNINFDLGIIYLLDTKNGERREVLMNDTVKRALVAVPKHPDSSYVFCHKSGKPYYNVRKSFDATLKKCDIIDFRFHDLRHTFASQLVMMGIDLKTIQELMGHKSIEMTLRYSHLSPDHKKKAVEILGKNVDTFWTLEPKKPEITEIDNLPNSLKELELVQ
jgi:Site-specific recombinase XerD